MSKTRKKKATSQLQKQAEAENRKKFLEKVKWFLTISGHPEVYKLIPPKHLIKLFIFRLHPPVLKINGRFPPGISNGKELQMYFSSILNHLKVTLPNGTAITFYDYFTIGHSCSVNFTSQSYLKLTCYQIINERMHDELNLFTEEVIEEKMKELVHFINLDFSSLSSSFYITYFDTLENKGTEIHPLYRFKFTLTEAHRATPVEIKIGDTFRPVYPIGWIDTVKFHQTFIAPQKLHLDTKIYRNKIPVFIQSHAIIRMNERLDFSNTGFIHFMAFASMYRPVIIRKGRTSYLIEFRINQFKVGYFTANLIGKRLVIRTFLLATQDGTPEEAKFRQITGLTREDIDFLKMTKISSFAKSGIESNSRLKAIFEEAGLFSIVECANTIYCRNPYSYRVSDLLDQYLDIEADTPNWDEVTETVEAEFLE